MHKRNCKIWQIQVEQEFKKTTTTTTKIAYATQVET